jgi:hypothetical protein
MSSTRRHLLLDFFWQVISGPPCIFVLKNNLKLLLEDEKNDIDMINCMPTKTTIIRSPYLNVKLQVSIYRVFSKLKRSF